jgi:hypothetical protein
LIIEQLIVDSGLWPVRIGDLAQAGLVDNLGALMCESTRQEAQMPNASRIEVFSDSMLAIVIT